MCACVLFWLFALGVGLLCDSIMLLGDSEWLLV